MMTYLFAKRYDWKGKSYTGILIAIVLESGRQLLFLRSKSV